MFGENIKWHLQANYSIVVLPQSYNCCILVNHVLWLNPDLFLFLLFIPRLCKGMKMKGRELLWFLQTFSTFSQFPDTLNHTQCFPTILQLGCFVAVKSAWFVPRFSRTCCIPVIYILVPSYPILSCPILPCPTLPIPFSCILIAFQPHGNLDCFYPFFFSYNERALKD